MTVFFIAEAGVNHNGDWDRALEMVDAAKEAGADAIKFQTFSADKVVSPFAEKAEYQTRETGEGSQFEMLSTLEMSFDLHSALFDRCSEIGIEFMSTAFDDASAQFLVELGIKRIKIPSGELTNHPFLAFLAQFDLPMILSTGMSTMEEIKEAVGVIDRERRALGQSAPLAERLTVLHCTSNYPASCADVNLRAMASIASETRVPIGYSDHTLGLSVSTAAVALGAQIIEKHFTLDRNLPGPDQKASLEPGELKSLIAQIREVELALGSPTKEPTPSELQVREVARRSVCAKVALEAGHVLKAEDLIMLRPATGIAPKDLDSLPGRKVLQAIPAGTPIAWTMVS